MPSSENLFTLDPLKTSLTKPTTDVKVQGPANRSVENSQLLQGLKTFGNAVGSLAEVKKQQQITEDTRLAQNAAIKGEAEPGGIFGIASEAYDRIIEANTLSKASRDMQAFIDGADGADLINAGGAYSENIAAADKVFDTFKAYGASSYLNPQMLYEFYNTVETKRNKVKNEIALVNRDRNRNQVIQRIANVIEKTADVSKDIYSGGVESDSSDIEGTDEYPILFSLDSNITPELHNTLANDTVDLNMGIERPEAKRLVLQMFLQNETVIAQPSLADKLMASEYSPGVTYEALYIKGALASNTDKDAADIFKMRNVQIQASFDHQKALDDQDKADAITRTNLGKSFVIQSLDSGGSNAEAYQIGFDNGLRKDEITTLIKAQDNFEGNLTFGTNTQQGQAFKKEILAGKNLSEDAITVKMRELNLDPADAAYYKGLASLENKEILVAQKAFDSEIKIIEAKTFQILKSALNNNKAITLDENGDVKFDMAALASQAAGGTQGLDPNEIQDVILRLQRLQNDYKYKSSEASKEVARSNTFDRAAVTQFGVDYNKDVALFISDLKNNIISRSQVRDARNKEDKEVFDRTKANQKGIKQSLEREAFVLPKPTVIEEIEIKKKILTDPTSHIKNEIDVIKDAYKSLFSTDPKPAPKSSKEAKEKSVIDRPISESEQAYLKKLEQSVPTSPPEESVSTTGLGSFADRIDANFAALPGIINDMQRERVLQKGLNLFFEGGVSDFKESFPITDLSRDRAFEETAAQKLGFGEETPADTAEVPAGGGSEEQLVGKGLSEPGPTPIPKGSHRVQRGETLSSIARTFDTTVDEIAKLNNITDPQKIQAGAMLKVKPTLASKEIPSSPPSERQGFFQKQYEEEFRPQIEAKQRVLAEADRLATIYNASPKDKDGNYTEREKWAANGRTRYTAYKDGNTTDDQNDNIKALKDTLLKYQEIIKGKLNGTSFEDFQEYMILTYGAETHFGINKGPSPTKVVGELQVTRPTLMGEWSKQGKRRWIKGVIGKTLDNEMAKALKLEIIDQEITHPTDGTKDTRKVLRGYSTDEKLKKLLQDNQTFSFMAGVAVMLNKLKR